MRRFILGPQRLAALGLLGLVLLNPPLLHGWGLTTGPDAFLYLFGIWGLLILLAAWIAEGWRD